MAASTTPLLTDVDAPSSVIFRETFGLRERLLGHSLYGQVRRRVHVQAFMRYHVFAVWDFMSLLTRLRIDLTGCQVPWLPPADPELARFLNEIVLGEESDVIAAGNGHTSHFELYRSAMREVDAPTSEIDGFVERVRLGEPVGRAFVPGTASFVQDFVVGNVELAERGATHEVASAFCFGREDVIPEMFARLLPTLRANADPLRLLTYYVERHIEVDGDHHGPLAMRLIDVVVGDDRRKLDAAVAAAMQALEARIHFWNGIEQALDAEVLASADT